MAKWMVAAKKADFERIADKFHITPVMARLLRNRDVIEDEDIRKFLAGTMEDLHNPMLMKDMEQAADIIWEKIQKKAAIRIIGDYDVDGICATYILLKGIQTLGGCVDTVIPHRMKDGYGLNEHLIEEASRAEVDTVITCDNGIAAAPQIRLAKEKGMTVVVTDHHEVPYEEKDGKKYYILPEADAVVDPKQEDCSYPYKQICGAVVAYKLVQVLLKKAELVKLSGQEIKAGEQKEESDAFDRQKLLQELLMFAALATVCDVMELKDENRIIVKKGLGLMANPQNKGLKALLAVNGIDGKPITPYHAGFIIGPCMNATGRLDTAGRALELFTCSDEKEAIVLATDLKSLNESRKQMTEEGVKSAIRQVEEAAWKEDRVLVVYLPDCHESLAGIIAGKVKEKFGKPTFVLTKGEEGVKGSGRSIEAYSMYEEMTACKELFTKYGGHKMAAGLSLAGEEMIEKFRKALNENCQLTDEDFEEVVHIDVPMPLNMVSKRFVEEISCLEPFGVGNQKPLFARKDISLLRGRILGKNRNVGKYKIADEEGNLFDMVYFGDIEKFDIFLKERYGEKRTEQLYIEGVDKKEIVISMAYYPEMNYFGGRESLQIIMQHYC